MAQINQRLEDLKNTLYIKVNTNDDISKIKQSLEKCDRNSLQSWTDDSGYNILHHSILSNNIEAVGIIFALGLFKPPHEPGSHPYIHLASNLGNQTVVSMILQERPRDNKVARFKWVSAPKVGPNAGAVISTVAPLDVAGDSGHIGCVKTILNFCSGGNMVVSEVDNHLCRACKNNSPSALRLLLTQKPSEEDVKAAVGCAHKLANAECLDALLKCNPPVTKLFRGMNLYHVLFSYSLSFKKEWYESLLTVTTVLLKYRQNPMCPIPFCTYPLYSLLSHTPASDFGKSFPYMIACLILLLNAGVDPNFNEIEVEEQNRSHNIQSAFGRSAFASSFHCLFEAAETYTKQFEDETMNIKRYLTKCVETLIKHGADPNINGPVGNGGLSGNALHAFMNIILLVGIDNKTVTIFKTFIYTGADVNGCPTELFPVNVLCNNVLTNVKPFEVVKKRVEPEFTEQFKDIVQCLLDRMTHISVIKASKVEYDGKPIHDNQRKLFKFLKDEVNKRANTVWSMKQMCKTEVLHSCYGKTSSIMKLPIPTALKQFLCDANV